MKNIIAIKNRILFHMDRTRSPRYTNEVISYAIQTAVDDFIKDRYDNIKDAEARYAFETVQRVRDEIRTVVEITLLTPTVLKQADLPPDYMYDVGVKQLINNVWRNSTPKTLSERLGGERNMYFRSTSEYPSHEQIGSKLRCYTNTGSLTSIELYYISKYELPYIYDGTIASGVNVLTDGYTYHVETDAISYNGTDYQVTDTFTASGTLTFTGAGVVRRIIEVPLPEATHEELARRSAAILSGIVENFNRNEIKEREIKKQ